jgi:hypothetical protein
MKQRLQGPRLSFWRQVPGRMRRGQAIIWLLATLAASAGALYALFNVSQVTVGKQRAVNAADAAALAGATAQARLLNLMAYSNRGMVANEVFLVQLLSIEAWMQYIEKTAGNFGTVLDIASLIPPLAPIAKPIGTVLDKISDVAGEIRDAFKDKVVPLWITAALEPAKAAIKLTQSALHLGGGLLAEDAAKNTVAANRSNFGGRMDAGVSMADTAAVRAVTFAINEKNWLEFSKLYDTTSRTDGRDILLASRDKFSASRPGRDWLNFSVLVVGLEKNGGSDLKGFDRWETQDTLETWAKVPCKTGICKEYTPIGWGRATADKTGTAGSTWGPNRSAQSLARAQGGRHKDWTGVPALYDIADKKVASREKLGLDFVVAVSRPGGNDFSTQGLGMATKLTSPLGSPDMPRRQEANQNTAFSKARVFFERPRRGLSNDFTASSLWRPDSAKEYGSLYSPYWQARLRDLTLVEKGSLITAMGLTPDKAVYTPGGQTP